MQFPIDLNRYNGDSISIPGVYPAVIVLAEVKQSKSGNDYLDVKFQTKNGAINLAKSLKETALWSLNLLARKAGLTSSEMERFSPEMLVGREVVIEVESVGAYFEVKSVMPKEAAQHNNNIDVPF